MGTLKLNSGVNKEQEVAEALNEQTATVAAEASGGEAGAVTLQTMAKVAGTAGVSGVTTEEDNVGVFGNDVNGLFTFVETIQDGDDVETYYGDIEVRCEDGYPRIETDIKINAALLPSSDSIVAAYLQITALFDSCGSFYIDNKEFAAEEDRDYKIDITEKLKTLKGTEFRMNVIPGYSPSYVNFGLSGEQGIKIVVLYRENKSDYKYKEISIGNNAQVLLNLRSGAYNEEVSSINLNDLSIPLNITHCHSKSNKDVNYGLGWKFNIEKKLKVAGRGAWSNVYYYLVDGLGDTHTFKEIFYYLDSNRHS